jgi:hypothetical protein
MGCLYYPRKQISVSHAADCDGIRCYGEAKPTDLHLLSTIRAVDDEIIEWLERHEHSGATAKGAPSCARIKMKCGRNGDQLRASRQLR